MTSESILRRALSFAAFAAIAAVCMSGCGDGGGAGPRPMAREYTVEVVSDGVGAAGSGSYEEGATVAISAGAAPDSTMQFKHWTSSAESGVVFADADSSTTTFVMPAKVVTVTAVFEARDAEAPKTYAAVVSSPGKGATGSGDYVAGATVSISAGAAPDSMEFKNWATTTGDGVIFANADSVKTSFIMPANAVTVTAVFEWKSVAPPTTYAVKVTSAGTGASGDGNYATGATVTISAGTPPDGKTFGKWTGSGVVFAHADSATTTFIMPARAVTVTASFDSLVVVPPKTYTAVVSSAGAESSGGGEYAAGDTVTISAGTPPEGQKFKNWRPVGVTLAHADSATTTFVMPAKDVAVVAVFEPEGVVITPPTTYAVTVLSSGANHSGGGEYEAGDSVKISAGTPPEGQQFKKWTSPAGSGVVFADTNSAATSFIMPAKAVTVTAVFEQKIITYKVTISGGGAGFTGGGDYTAGATVNISAGTPPAGQQFKNWTSSDGVIFAGSSSSATTFIMPAKAVTVTAVFEPIPPPTTYAVTVSSVGTGATGGGNYAAGATVSISAGAAPSGQRFKNWTTASAGVTFANANSATTTFTMPAGAVTVTANFEWSFKTVVIGGNTWMAENLNVSTATGSWCYENSPDSCAKYGRLYNWVDATHACPNGWHLPSKPEWENLITTAGGGTVAGQKLKSTSGWNSGGNGTDDFGFFALPAGGYFGDIFYGAGIYGRWWTATEGGSGDAYYRDLDCDDDNVYEFTEGKDIGYSVRCVQD